jgi:hypothetical protein
VAAKNQDCPTTEIIKTKIECIKAAEQKGLEYRGDVSYPERPAGCYESLGRGLMYFNRIIDPASTSPSPHAGGWNSAGVCVIQVPYSGIIT